MFLKNIKIEFFSIFLLLMLFLGCDPKKNLVEVQITDSQITISPQKVASSEQDTISFLLYQPGVNYVEWQLASKPVWLVLDKENGKVNQEGDIVKATFRKDLIKFGDYVGDISFVTGGAGTCEASVSLYAYKYPDPYFYPSELIFENDEDKKTVEILNKGNGAMFANCVIPKNDWLYVGHCDAYIFPQNHGVIPVSVNKNNIEPGIARSQVIVYYNQFKDSLILPVTVHIPELKEIVFSSDTLSFFSKDNSRTIAFINIGNVGFDWSVETSSPFLKCKTPIGNVERDGTVKLDIDIDRSNLTDGVHYFSLKVKDSDGNDLKSMIISVRNFKNPIYEIEGDVLEAKYSKVLDRLIIVTQNPNELKIYNTVNKHLSKIALSRSPNSCSLSPDGKFAVIGYDGAFSYINLESEAEEYYKFLPFDCYDQVVNSEGRIFFSTSSEIRYTYCYDINDNQLVILDSNKTIFKKNMFLHQSEKFILATSTNIDKYNIFKDSIVFDYEWYHKNYKANGNIWFLDNGNRIICQNSQVYGFNSDDYQELFYISKINYPREVVSFDCSEQQKKVCVINKNDMYSMAGNELLIYDYDYLGYIKKIELPMLSRFGALEDYQYHLTSAEYGFFNNSGTKLITLLKAIGPESETINWGVYCTEY